MNRKDRALEIASILEITVKESTESLKLFLPTAKEQAEVIAELAKKKETDYSFEGAQNGK